MKKKAPVRFSLNSVKLEVIEHRKADKQNPDHVAAPLQGLLSKVHIQRGDAIRKNQPLFVIEAMKMETVVTAPADGQIEDVILAEGVMVNTNDLVLELSAS
jgi:pyruvate carboxylase